MKPKQAVGVLLERLIMADRHGLLTISGHRVVYSGYGPDREKIWLTVVKLIGRDKTNSIFDIIHTILIWLVRKFLNEQVGFQLYVFSRICVGEQSFSACH